MANTEDLSDFVRRTMNEKGLSTYDVQKAANNRITAATVTKILNREIKSSGVETLTALASGLGVSAEDLINIARGIKGKPTRFEIYAETFDAHDISESEWQMLETYFRDHVKTWQRWQKERQLKTK